MRDLSAEVLPRKAFQTLKKAEKLIGEERKDAGQPVSNEFNSAIHRLYGLDSHIEITPETKFDDLKPPIMETLAKGFDYYNAQMQAGNYEKGNKQAHIFLDAMSFLNRGEAKYQANFETAVTRMATVEMMQAKTDLDNSFNEFRQKQERREGWQGLGIAIRGVYRQFKNYDQVRDLLDNFHARLDRATEVSNFIVSKGSIKQF